MTTAAPQKAAREMKRLAVTISEMKLDPRGPGTGSGYLAVFGNIDLTGDRIKQGAFKKTLLDLEAKRSKRSLPYLMPYLWQHDPERPQGGYTLAREDAKGLYVEWEWDLDTQVGREGYSAAKKGYCNSQSIGYDVVLSDWAKDPQAGNVRELIEIRLWEGSQVTFPANPEATIDSVKNVEYEAPETLPPAEGVNTVPDTMPTGLSFEDIQDAIEDALPKDDDGYPNGWAVRTWPDKVIYRIYGDDSDAYWLASYVISADGTALLGQATEMERSVTFTPAEKAAHVAQGVKRMLARGSKAGRRHGSADLAALHDMHKSFLKVMPEAEHPAMAKAMADHLVGKSAHETCAKAMGAMGGTLCAKDDDGGMSEMGFMLGKDHTKAMVGMLTDGDEAKSINAAVDALKSPGKKAAQAALEAKTLDMLQALEAKTRQAQPDPIAEALQKLAQATAAK